MLDSAAGAPNSSGFVAAFDEAQMALALGAASWTCTGFYRRRASRNVAKNGEQSFGLDLNFIPSRLFLCWY
jgi:hypothetical protein